MEVSFVLVEPQVPENVGAAARALKTMGFSSLRLVNTKTDQQPQAAWLAHGSNDVLENAQHFTDLTEAVADCQLVVGTTAKLRNGFRELVTPNQLTQQLNQQSGVIDRVAVVFGREDRGLSNQELSHCQQISSIPLVNSYPSLNLSQAVMLYAYELSGLSVASRHTKPAKNEDEQLAKLSHRVAMQLSELGFHEQTALAEWASEKVAKADVDSVRFLHSLCSVIEKQSSHED